MFHFFKIYQRLTKVQKPKNSNKLSEFALIFRNNFTNTHHFNKGVSTPINPQLLVFSMLVVYWHEICPTTHLGRAILYFHLLACFLQTIKFRHQGVFSTLNLIMYLALNNHQFPITSNYNLCPWQFCNPHFLENTI